ncbi:uncharacterized protein LAJ45_02634 [Morchella importuna]|uniref:uncharacterized protein n=1 Tax=Morchella importuna TaxID=1174673 RepID=UPI001E8CCB18|nr:uncharacterized protein LAJ45_02634 [Morchella importuna]KAH8153047.1 hypothetical protein LAJ45_02634 [Morchella importuna]
MGLRPFRVRGAQVQDAKRVMTLKRFEKFSFARGSLFILPYVQYMLELPIPPFVLLWQLKPPRGKCSQSFLKISYSLTQPNPPLSRSLKVKGNAGCFVCWVRFRRHWKSASRTNDGGKLQPAQNLVTPLTGQGSMVACNKTGSSWPAVTVWYRQPGFLTAQHQVGNLNCDKCVGPVNGAGSGRILLVQIAGSYFCRSQRHRRKCTELHKVISSKLNVRMSICLVCVVLTRNTAIHWLASIEGRLRNKREIGETLQSMTEGPFDKDSRLLFYQEVPVVGS